MTYLAEGPRMSFFAVEVDHFVGHLGDGAVLVPRSALIPSWVGAPAPAANVPDLSSPAFTGLIARMDEFANERGLTARQGRTGKLFRATRENAWGVGVYASGRGVEFDLAGLREDGGEDLADGLQSILSVVSGRPQPAKFPSVPCQCVLDDWERVRRDVLEPYFAFRANAATSTLTSKA